MKWTSRLLLLLAFPFATVASEFLRIAQKYRSHFTNELGVGQSETDESIISVKDHRLLQNFGVEAYECGNSNTEVTSPSPKSQGDRIRICFRPDPNTRENGVVLNSINTLRFVRDDVSQDIILPDSVIKDFQSTIYFCTPGDELCFVSTFIDNSFFFSTGEITVEGIVWLQYGDNVEQAGQFIGGSNFDFRLPVEPSGTDWDAVAYLCNGNNQPLRVDGELRPRNSDDEIRVCVTPSPSARQAGVFVRSIDSFYFEKEDERQVAIESPGVSADETLYICNAGNLVCAFKTSLASSFFETDARIRVVGEVILQYGDDPQRLLSATEKDSRRSLQVESDFDAGFAGRSDVVFEFDVDPDYIPSAEKTWKDKAEEWWKGTSLFLRIVYVLAAIIGFIIMLCFTYAICCGLPCIRKKENESLGEKAQFSEMDQAKTEPDAWDVETEHRTESRKERSEPNDRQSGSRTTYDDDEALEGSMELEDNTTTKSPKRRSSKAGSTKLLRRESSQRSTASGSMKSPRPSNAGSTKLLLRESSQRSTTSRSMKSPRPSRKSSIANGELQSSLHSRRSVASKSPRSGRRSVGREEEIQQGPTYSRKSTASKSPKPRRSNLGETEGSTRSRKSMASKSPKPRRSNLGETEGSAQSRKSMASKSPKPRRRQLEDTVSPLPRSSQMRSSQVKALDGLSTNSEHSRRSTASGRRASTRPSKSPRRPSEPGKSPLSARGGARTPSSRRSTIKGETPRSRRTPAGQRSSVENGVHMPTELPF